MVARAGLVRSTFVLLALVVTLALASARVEAQSFELLDDDVVVLLGDSNTAPGTYQRYLERYTAIRFPERDIRYINMGIGGDTAVGGLARLQRDVFDRGATALIVTYGINDICWGFCDDDAHRQAYYQAIIDIIIACVNHGVRVYVTTYPYRGAASQPLQDMTSTGAAIATYLGETGIDIYTTMKNIDTGAAQTQQCLTDAEEARSAPACSCRPVSLGAATAPVTENGGYRRSTGSAVSPT
jgi:lysophospholipase L1-like esterase